MKRRNHIGFLKCYRCSYCGKIVLRDGRLLSKGSRMEFSELEIKNAIHVHGNCCVVDVRNKRIL